MVEAGAGGVVVPHVPFADEGGFVAGFLEDLREGFEMMAPLAAVGVVENPMMMGVESRQQAGPHRRAQRRRAKRIAEPRPFRGQPVDVRRLHKGMPHTGEFIPPQIIDQDHDKIRPRFRLCFSHGRGAEKSDQQNQ